MSKKKLILIIVLSVVVIFVAFLAMRLFKEPNPEYKSALDKEGKGRVNVLVVGVDKDGTRSDVNMLFSMDKKTKTIDLISIPRDTRIEYASGKHGKINACLGKKDGDALLINTIKEITGMPVHHYCKVTFEGLRNIIDILGGVEYDVPMDMDYDDPAQDLHIHLKKGRQTLNGHDAEGLLRFRKGYATGDLGRIDVQQDFFRVMIDQKLDVKYIFKAIPIAEEISKCVDTDMSAARFLGFAWDFKNKSKLNFRSHTLPGAAKMIGGVSYYLCDEAATKAFVETTLGGGN